MHAHDLYNDHACVAVMQLPHMEPWFKQRLYVKMLIAACTRFRASRSRRYVWWVCAQACLHDAPCMLSRHHVLAN